MLFLFWPSDFCRVQQCKRTERSAFAEVFFFVRCYPLTPVTPVKLNTQLSASRASPSSTATTEQVPFSHVQVRTCAHQTTKSIGVHTRLIRNSIKIRPGSNFISYNQHQQYMEFTSRSAKWINRSFKENIIN